MKGIELSEKYYLEYGVPMLHEKFPEIEGLLAVGVAGSGSDVLGYDDDISADHDFEAGFCIFLPDEDIIDSRTAFALERAYAKLPKEFMGYKRSPLSPVGGNRHGVIRTSEFLADKIGSADGRLTLKDWFFIPEQSLLEVTDGKIFRDDSGFFSRVRGKLEYFPEDVRLKKLAGNLLMMGQTGQYNYYRCIRRGETAAAQLAMHEFVKSALNAVFLLNKRYIPYYKWTFRALMELPMLSHLYGALEYLISSGNTEDETRKKQNLIEDICRGVVAELLEQGLSDYSGNETEGHAYSVNQRIGDGNIRNLHILYAV